MVGVLNGKKGKAFVVVAFLLCGVFGGLVVEQSLAQSYYNLALGCSASASTEFNSAYLAGKAVDGSVATRWCNDGNGGEDWVRVDAGVLCTVYNVTVRWENTATYNVSFQRSDDGVSWVNVTSWVRAAGMDLVDSVVFRPVNTRYMRLLVYDAAAFTSCYEFEVYGVVVEGVSESTWLGVGISFGLVAISLLLALKSRSWAVNFLFGLSLVGFLGWQFANVTVELFGGWLDFMVLVGAVLVLVKGAVLVRASGV